MGRFSMRMIVVLLMVSTMATACFDNGDSSDERPEDATTIPAAPVTTASTAPLNTTTTGRAAGEPLVYTVQEGDTLGSIASNFNTTVELLVEVNNIADPNSLQVGQELIIPAPGTTPGADSTTSSTAPGG
jgi:LysM repeat protein